MIRFMQLGRRLIKSDLVTNTLRAISAVNPLVQSISRRKYSTTSETASNGNIHKANLNNKVRRSVVADAPDIRDFIQLQRQETSSTSEQLSINNHSKPLKFFIETYGCQMNSSDSDIVRSILISQGHQSCDDLLSADLILTNTCAIRENAEDKVWHRLAYFQSLRQKNRLTLTKEQRKRSKGFSPMVGVLGCMAGRLKSKLLEEESVDFVCGPDAYRDIPRLINEVTSTDQKEANTQLSLEETYLDITPVRESSSCSAFVSIMRGCNNMCSFCIVPFTRGRERSRPMTSIKKEVQSLIDQGVKEIVLLGQNVNGFHDTSPESAESYPGSKYVATPGFSNLFNSRLRDKPGARFVDLLSELSSMNPEVRFRFTSPHPKDFPTEVLSLIAERPNLCSSLHLPFQSGSSSVLERMRRGYTKEAYLELIARAKEIIGPQVTFSTDVITGFCGETEEEHKDTLSLMSDVKFDQAFMFIYSLREKTHAAHTMTDDVPEAIKSRRLQEIIEVYRNEIQRKNGNTLVGSYQLVLVEGPANKSIKEYPTFTGRDDGNRRVVFPGDASLFPTFKAFTDNVGHLMDVAKYSESLVPSSEDALVAEKMGKHVDIYRSQLAYNTIATSNSNINISSGGGGDRECEYDCAGHYIVVKILKVNSTTLRGIAVARSTIQEFAQFK